MRHKRPGRWGTVGRFGGDGGLQNWGSGRIGVFVGRWTFGAHKRVENRRHLTNEVSGETEDLGMSGKR